MNTDKTKIASDDLRERLDKWVTPNAATKFITLYNSCVKDNPKDRLQSMNDVAILLREIRSLILDPESTHKLTEDTFLQQVFFSIFGLNKTIDSNFLSKSGRTSVTFEQINSKEIIIKFAIVAGYSGLRGKYDAQRDALARYLDSVISSYNKKGYNITRSLVREDIFACKIHIKGNNLTYAKTNDIISFINEAISQLEK